MTLLNVINVAFCVVIAGLGYVAYKETKSTLPIFVAVGFGLFGFSHLITLLGLEGKMINAVIIMRVFAYLIMSFSLLMVATQGNDKKRR